MRGSKIRRFQGFFERRRARQADGESPRTRAYTYELAVLHLQLLVAMAAIDEQVRHAEVEEVLAFIDRPSLKRDDLERLEQFAKVAITNPPQLEPLLTQLSKFASKPAVARQVVEDLAKVAAADLREDPRETELLGTVCDALNVARVPIRIDEEPLPPAAFSGGSAQPALSRGPKLVVTQYRARAAVRKALEESYREEARRDGSSS